MSKIEKKRTYYSYDNYRNETSMLFSEKEKRSIDRSNQQETIDTVRNRIPQRVISCTRVRYLYKILYYSCFIDLATNTWNIRSR